MTMLAELIEACGLAETRRHEAPLQLVETPFDLTANLTAFGTDGDVSRVAMAHALNVALFIDLLGRVPSGASYVDEQLAQNRRIVLDHGAVRTVAWPTTSAVPAGAEQVARILEPLGYSRRNTYPLTRLRMTGYSYAHDDLSDDIGQWFVSEFHPDEYSPEFKHAVEQVIGTSEDPVDAESASLLDQLGAERRLPRDTALALMPILFSCFARLHNVPLDTDYDILRTESAEMAWIATEGTAFNHATDRVADVQATADRELQAGRPIKEKVEVSSSGRVRQTAHRATLVERQFRTAEGSTISRDVPGSFFEFIDRQPLPDESGIDLAFDASNAQGIFKMTASEQDRGRASGANPRGR